MCFDAKRMEKFPSDFRSGRKRSPENNGQDSGAAIRGRASCESLCQGRIRKSMLSDVQIPNAMLAVKGHIRFRR
jgi:hypothetical protein